MEMFEYRPFADVDDQAFRDVLFHTLYIPLHAWETFPDRIGRENLRALTHAGRLIGGMGIYRAGLWFGGVGLRSTRRGTAVSLRWGNVA